jgi:tagatose 6-phosphate kinase
VITVAGFNTSVDKAAEADTVRPGAVHRLRNVRAWPGGKGLHVALTVAALGEPVRLVGLIDRAHARWFESFLREKGVAFDGVDSPAGIRSCLGVRDAEGRITEFLEPGPELDAGTQRTLASRVIERSAASAVCVLSGSLPPGFGDRAYAELVRATAPARCLVDASGPTLREAVEVRPFLVKPNRQEAEDLLGRPIETVADAGRAARELFARGVSLPVVSLGRDGAVACADGRVRHAVVSLPAAVNPVGSGDCLLGGAAVGLARGLAPDAVLKLGVACGAANALTAETGMLRARDVESLRTRVRIAELA